MTLDNAWMIAMVGMFGLFLVGIWMEARRSLRALIEDDFGLNEIKACEEDYRAVMTRLEARSRLSEMRMMNTGRHLSQNLNHSLNHNFGPQHKNGHLAPSRMSQNGYNLG